MQDRAFFEKSTTLTLYTIAGAISALANNDPISKISAEYTVDEDSPVTDIPLMTMKKKPDILIAAIIRGGKVLIPRGSDVISAGDRVVVVTRAKAIDGIADILL